MKRLFLFVLILTITIFTFADEALTIDEAGKIWIMIDNQQVELTSFLNPTGTIQAFGGQINGSGAVEATPGWLYCNGASVSQTKYSTLYNIIAYTFNPTDSNDDPIIISGEFSLPDLRGIFLRGAGINGSMTKKNMSLFNGGEVGKKFNDKIQNITGSVTGLNRFAANPGSASGAFTRTYSVGQCADETSHNYNRITGFYLDVSRVVRTGDETNPASVSVNYIIKY